MSNLAYNLHTLPVRIPIQDEKYQQCGFASDYSTFLEQLPKCHSRVPLDIQERTDQFVICVYLGDVHSENCSVILYDGMLMISVNHKRDNHNSFKKLEKSLCECFRFTTLLPESANSYDITAHHTENVLKIIVPKKSVEIN